MARRSHARRKTTRPEGASPRANPPGCVHTPGLAPRPEECAAAQRTAYHGRASIAPPGTVLTLRNDTLAVDVLDPVADRARFGMRYCTGGYLFQITDARHGPLLSGPTYPDSFNWRDGQGIPDAFSHRPLRDPASGGTTALIIGVGRCDLASKEVEAFCTWEVALAQAAVTMRTAQQGEGFALTLERTVTLAGRTVRSATRVVNEGAGTLPICWFPHPFFPQPAGPELCRIHGPVTLPENPGYRLAPSGFLARKAPPPPKASTRRSTTTPTRPPPSCSGTTRSGSSWARCSYVPSLFPVWGNARTFSWEPFFERTLGPGEAADWWITYDF